jgi:hypothetical protein
VEDGIYFETDLYEKHAFEMPGLNTMRALETRQDYLIEKLQSRIESDDDNISFLIKEIIAMKKALNFIKWILGNSSDEMIKSVIEKYKLDNCAAVEHTDEPEEDDKPAEGEDAVYDIFDEKLTNNKRLQIIVTVRGGNKYISLEMRRRKSNEIVWTSYGKTRITLNKYERILRRVHERMNEIENKGGNVPLPDLS